MKLQGSKEKIDMGDFNPPNDVKPWEFSIEKHQLRMEEEKRLHREQIVSESWQRVGLLVAGLIVLNLLVALFG